MQTMKNYLTIAFILTSVLFTSMASGQQVNVSGIITEAANGEELPGVSVVVKGTTLGTVSDINGSYSIMASTDDLLVFSFIGYEIMEAPVPSSGRLDITLESTIFNMEEVVVIGYGTMKKSDLTGAVSSVTSGDLTAAPVSGIGEALQGRASGLQVINAGKPGDNVTMKIRGLGTINDSDPLVVIDGVPTDLGLNALNPNDIETVDVLKDASATAIYGARGANGVVMITTKRGKKGESNISFSSNYSIQEAIGMPTLLNASQYVQLNNEMLQNAGMATNPAWADPSSLSKGTDWMGELIDLAPMQNYSLSYSGGSENSTYYVSGSVFDQEGLIRNTKFRRYTFQFNNDSQVKEWIKFSNQLTVSHDIKSQGDYDIMGTMRALPTQPLYFADGSWSGPEGPVEWVGGLRNPIGTTEKNTQETKGYNVLGNISAEIKLFKGLKFKTLGGVDFKSWYGNSFTPAYAWKPIAVETSYKHQSSNKSLTYLWDNYFTYDQSFGKHSVNAMGGISAQTNRFDFMSGAVNTFLRDENNQLDNGLKIQSLNGNASEWALLSYIGRINYTFANKYLLTATVRRDGSSRFGENNKWGIFPSFSGAWRMSEESWFPDFYLLNDLKARVGYGVTGNQNIGNYEFAAIYDMGTYMFNGNPVSTLVANRMPNPNIMWEEVEQFNLGLDLSMLNQRLMLTVDGYLKNTNNMLVPMAVPISTGYSDHDVPNINAGQMTNKGIELSLTAHILRGALDWTTSVNTTLNKNEIVDLNSDSPMYQNSIENSNITIQSVNHPMNSFYGFVVDGIFQSPQEVSNSAVQIVGGTAPGDIRFKDLNNDGIINDQDRTFIGNPNPGVIFSMNNRLAWKGFDLEIFLHGNAGNDIYNANRMTLEGMKVSENQSTAVLNRWTPSNTNTTIPRAIYDDPNKNTRASNRYIEDGSYLRLKNVSLGYSIPKQILNRFEIGEARIYLSAQNLATITGYSGIDPEVGINGIDYGAYPLTRTFSVGLNLNF